MITISIEMLEELSKSASPKLKEEVESLLGIVKYNINNENTEFNSMSKSLNNISSILGEFRNLIEEDLKISEISAK